MGVAHGASRHSTNYRIHHFLETKFKALELLQNAQVPKTTTTSPRSTQPVGAKVGKSSHCNLATQVLYSLCKGSHRLFKCDTFLRLQPKQRFSHAKQLEVCLNCLQPFTKFHTCSEQVCRKCNKRHHTLLHMNRQNQVANDKGSTSSNLPADSKGSPTVEINIYCFLKSKPRNHIFLALAIVGVKK